MRTVTADHDVGGDVTAVPAGSRYRHAGPFRVEVHDRRAGIDGDQWFGGDDSGTPVQQELLIQVNPERMGGQRFDEAIVDLGQHLTAAIAPLHGCHPDRPGIVLQVDTDRCQQVERRRVEGRGVGSRRQTGALLHQRHRDPACSEQQG
ncbi:MAG: hypothetical protein EBU54_07205 [Mycobacteriaceae bacterium]|nr:hypothetical protein [Mycobacteriaceae bacterium]